jgi:hypothetical protein
VTADTRRDYNREQKAAARARARAAADADRIVSALQEFADRIVSALDADADRIVSALLSALSPGQGPFSPENLSATVPGATTTAPKGPSSGAVAPGNADTNGRGHADSLARGQRRCRACGRLAFLEPCEHCATPTPPPADLRTALGERDLDLPPAGRRDLA